MEASQQCQQGQVDVVKITRCTVTIGEAGPRTALIEYSDGCKYIGSINEENQHCGEGTFIWPNDDMYIGHWLNGKYHGKGKLTKTNAPEKTISKYEGDFVNGLKDGTGTAHFINGAVYVGEWSKDKRNGKGKQTDPNGSYYDGEWLNDKHHGIGTRKYSSRTCEKYIGQWKDGKYNGKGILESYSGSYNGEWLNGKRHGHGITTCRETIEVGHWRNDAKYGVSCVSKISDSSYVEVLHFTGGELVMGHRIEHLGPAKKHIRGKRVHSDDE